MIQAPPQRPNPGNFNFRDKALSVALIGAGGNGSEMLDGLMRIHQGMIALDAPGLQVHVFDDDVVEASNIVRQRFWPHEIGMNKATALVNSVNMLMGAGWRDYPRRVEPQDLNDIIPKVDLVITAVDNVALRQALALVAANRPTEPTFTAGPRANSRHRTMWCDLGCSGDKGQMVMGALDGSSLDDPLPNVIAHFPAMLEAEDTDTEPSCGAAQSLARQDLMINQQVSASAINLLWKMLRTGYMPYNGTIIDLACGLTQAIEFAHQTDDTETESENG